MKQTPPLTTPVMDQVQNVAEQAEKTGTDILGLARRAMLAYVGAAVMVQEEAEKTFNTFVQRGKKTGFNPRIEVQIPAPVTDLVKQARKEVDRVEGRSGDLINDVSETVARELQQRLGVASEDDVRQLNAQLDILNGRLDSLIEEMKADQQADARREAEKRAAERRVARERAAEEQAVREVMFAEATPIANYDQLNVEQIMAQLNELSVDELRAVRAHEADTKKRVTILRAMDERLNTLIPLKGYDAMTVDEVEREINDLSVDELRAIRAYEADHKNRSSLLENLDRRLNWLLPVEGYDEMNVDKAVTQFESFPPEDLRRIRQYEVEHKNRSTILAAIDRRLAILEAQA